MSRIAVTVNGVQHAGQLQRRGDPPRPRQKSLAKALEIVEYDKLRKEYRAHLTAVHALRALASAVARARGAA